MNTRNPLFPMMPDSGDAVATVEVAVIGAGPAGVAVAVSLSDRGLHPLLIDKAGVAASWRGRYDRLKLNTGKSFSHLPNRPYPRGTATFPTRDEVVAANRDDREFSAPDVFDITRDARRHLAFGHGAHYCLGAPLARLEAEIAFDRLLNRFDPITLDTNSDLRYRDSLMMRGLVTLPVYLGDKRFDALRSAS